MWRPVLGLVTVAGVLVAPATALADLVGRREAVWEVPAPERELGDAFGVSLGFDQDTVVVGSLRRGVVYVYTRDAAGTWSDPERLTHPSGDEFARYGSAVTISGDTIAVGAEKDGLLHSEGRVYLYRRGPSGWVLEGSVGPDQRSAGANDFGAAVALDGDTLVVGAPRFNAERGHAEVFVRSGTTWSHAANLGLLGTIDGDRVGTAVAVQEDLMLIGAPGRDGGAGAVRAFVRAGSSTWTEISALVPDGASGETSFGEAVDLDEQTAMVGAPAWPVAGEPTGAAFVFEREPSGAWREVSRLESALGARGRFGGAVALRGDRAIVGAQNARRGGVAVLFSRDSAGWSRGSELVPEVINPSELNAFGRAVEISDDTALVGANSDASGQPYGSVHVFAIGGGIGEPCLTDEDCGIGQCIDTICSIPDAGVSSPDAGSITYDAGWPGDAGGAPLPSSGGCTCRAGGTTRSSAAWIFLLVVVGALQQRRRGRHR